MYDDDKIFGLFWTLLAFVLVVFIVAFPIYYTNKNSSNQPKVMQVNDKQVVCVYGTVIKNFEDRQREYEEWDCK